MAPFQPQVPASVPIVESVVSVEQTTVQRKKQPAPIDIAKTKSMRSSPIAPPPTSPLPAVPTIATSPMSLKRSYPDLRTALKQAAQIPTEPLPALPSPIAMPPKQSSDDSSSSSHRRASAGPDTPQLTSSMSSVASSASVETPSPLVEAYRATETELAKTSVVAAPPSARADEASQTPTSPTEPSLSAKSMVLEPVGSDFAADRIAPAASASTTNPTTAVESLSSPAAVVDVFGPARHGIRTVSSSRPLSFTATKSEPDVDGQTSVPVAADLPKRPPQSDEPQAASTSTSSPGRPRTRTTSATSNKASIKRSKSSLTNLFFFAQKDAEAKNKKVSTAPSAGKEDAVETQMGSKKSRRLSFSLRKPKQKWADLPPSPEPPKDSLDSTSTLRDQQVSDSPCLTPSPPTRVLPPVPQQVDDIPEPTVIGEIEMPAESASSDTAVSHTDAPSPTKQSRPFSEPRIRPTRRSSLVLTSPRLAQLGASPALPKSQSSPIGLSQVGKAAARTSMSTLDRHAAAMPVLVEQPASPDRALPDLPRREESPSASDALPSPSLSTLDADEKVSWSIVTTRRPEEVDGSKHLPEPVSLPATLFPPAVPSLQRVHSMTAQLVLVSSHSSEDLVEDLHKMPMPPTIQHSSVQHSSLESSPSLPDWDHLFEVQERAQAVA